MSKIFENKEMMYKVGEVVVVLGITFYFHSRIKTLNQVVTEQKQKILEQEERIQNLEKTMGGILLRLNTVPTTHHSHSKPKNLQPKKVDNKQVNNKQVNKSSSKNKVVEEDELSTISEEDTDDELDKLQSEDLDNEIKEELEQLKNENQDVENELIETILDEEKKEKNENQNTELKKKTKKSN